MKYVSILIFLAISSSAFCEPSKVFQHLLTDKVSMLDWGIYRLDERLENMEFEGLDSRLHSRNSHASYDWDRSRVEISFTLYLNNESSNLEIAKESCSQITGRLRLVWGDQLPLATNVATFFEHSGFTNNNRPENFSSEIQNSTYIEVNVYGTDRTSPPYTPYSKLLVCENALLGEGIFSSEPTN